MFIFFKRRSYLRFTISTLPQVLRYTVWGGDGRVRTERVFIILIIMRIISFNFPTYINYVYYYCVYPYFQWVCNQYTIYRQQFRQPILQMIGYQGTQNMHGRQSLRTHLQRPMSMKQDNSILSYILVAACLIVIVYSLVESKQSFPHHNTKVIEQRERGELEQRISKGVIGKYSRQQVQTLEKQNMLIIPTIANLSSKCKTRKKSQIKEQTIANIQIFNMLHKFNRQMTKQQIFKKYFTKIIPLKAVKHHKFSSPRHDQQKISTFINDWFNPFYNRQEQQYRGIDRIFIANNQQVWSAYSSYGGFLTVVSDQLIKLAIIRVRTPLREQESQEKPQQQEDFLYIFGISALDTTLTNINTLQTTLIIKSPIGHGMNQIECNKQQCNMEYSMIMLMMADKKKIQILSIQLYQHKS